MSKQLSTRNTRWFALLLTNVMLLIWGVGLADAILGGLNPGYVSHAADRPYPVRGVLTVCGVITAESALLFGIVRPFSLLSHRRVLIALAVFVPLWIAEFILISGWTDQAGYCYSNGLFLLCAVCFLSVAAVLSILIFRRQGPANAA
jgi:hypothetical protein